MAAPMESAIENYVKGFDDSAAGVISHDLLDKQLSLVTFIENLGVYLTSKETSNRARATRLIADVLHSLPPNFLSQSEVGLLCTFLCEKLADHHSIHAHGLYGLLALGKCVNLSEEMVGTICRTIFRDVHTQSLPQGDRRTVFNLFLSFLTNRLKDVQKLEGDFVYGFMQAMDAEKDPRNLILSFSCACLVIEHFSLGVFVEEFFEVVSCYFPIDFTPSANDPSGIKKEDLILSLRRCMAASPKFAQYCLPLLMEKLTSDLKSAKIDALETLTECTKTYSTDSFNEFQSSFFNCIKKEVFLSGDTKVENAALEALQALVKALSTGITQSDGKKGLDGFVEEILHESKNHLLQPELMLMLSSGRLLQAASRGSHTACSQIVKTVIPMLIETYNKQTQPTPKYNVIIVINGFLECTIDYKSTDKNPHPILSTYKDHILMIYTGALDSDIPTLSVQAIKGFHTLLKLPADNLLETERSFISTKLVQVVVNAAVESEVRDAATDVLQFVLSTFPDIGEKFVLPVIFSTVKNEAMEVEGNQKISRHQGLEVLATITCDTRTVESVTNTLFPLLNYNESLEFYQALTKCLSHICEKCAQTSLQSLSKGAHKIHELVQQNVGQSNWTEVLSDQIVLKYLSSYLRHVAVNWTKEIRTELQTLFVESFLGKSTENSFAPLKNVVQARFVCLLTPVICSDSQKDIIPSYKEIITSLMDLLGQSLSEDAHQSVCKCLAGILNKLPANESLDEVLSNLKTTINKTDGGKHTPSNVRLLAWITKALVLRNHPVGKELCSLLFSLLSSDSGEGAARGYHIVLAKCDDVLNKKYIRALEKGSDSIYIRQNLFNLLSVVDSGEGAARGFHIVLSECDDVLNKPMRANIRMMYRQRFFQEHLSTVIQGHCDASQDTKQNYLLCLSYMIKGLSKQVLVPELSKIYPLLIQSLLCSDLDLQLTTMATLGDLIENSPEIVDKQLDSLLPQLLKLTRFQASMKVRISSLDCLSKLTMLPAHVIMPHLKSVTRALTPVLDDKKRLVRSRAAETRLEWFLLETENK